MILKFKFYCDSCVGYLTLPAILFITCNKECNLHERTCPINNLIPSTECPFIAVCEGEKATLFTDCVFSII